MLVIERYDTVSDFYSTVKPLLIQDEAKYNLALGILKRSLSKIFDPNDIFLTGKINNQPVIAVQQMDRAMIASGSSQYTKWLSEYLIDQHLIVNDFVGPKELVLQLSKYLSLDPNIESELIMDQMIYKLDRVKNTDFPLGNFREAALIDLEILSTYIQNFTTVIGEVISNDEAKKKAMELIKKGSLYVWDNNGVVSMANKARPSKNGVVVNLVYTPPEHQKRGYATACVAALSKLLLKDFDFCCLYTDLSNPTSNSIYQKIGYYPIAESAMVKISYRS